MKKLPINLNAFIFTSYMHENFANKFKYIYFGYFSYPVCMTNLLIKFFMTKNYFHNNGVPPVSSKLFFVYFFLGSFSEKLLPFSSFWLSILISSLLPTKAPIANFCSRQLLIFSPANCNFFSPALMASHAAISLCPLIFSLSHSRS